MENTQEYKTKDLGEAAALIVKSQKFLWIERQGKICFFVFEDKTSCARLSNDYFFGQLLVNARDYKEKMDMLKNRIFAG